MAQRNLGKELIAIVSGGYIVAMIDKATAAGAVIAPGGVFDSSVSGQASFGNHSSCIRAIGRIVVAVSKHVIAKDALAGGDEGDSVDKSADCGVVITGLQVIEPGIGVVLVAARA